MAAKSVFVFLNHPVDLLLVTLYLLVPCRHHTQDPLSIGFITSQRIDRIKIWHNTLKRHHRFLRRDVSIQQDDSSKAYVSKLNRHSSFIGVSPQGISLPDPYYPISALHPIRWRSDSGNPITLFPSCTLSDDGAIQGIEPEKISAREHYCF